MAFGSLENQFNLSDAADAASYWNTASPTLTLNTGDDLDSDNRAAGRQLTAGNRYLTETQTAATNDLTRPFIHGLGRLMRWYLAVRVPTGATSHARLYKNGSPISVTVNFTSANWILLDLGEAMRGIGDDVSCRVWGPDTIHVGHVYFCNRAIVFNASDVVVAGAAHTSVVTDAGSIGANVVQFHENTRDTVPTKILEFTPAVSPTEEIFPLMVARNSGTFTDPFTSHYENSTTKNGTNFGTTNHLATSFTGSLNRGPAIVQVNLGISGYPPAGNIGFTSCTVSDVIAYWAARETFSPPTDPNELIDQVVCVRGCACAFFSAYNTVPTNPFSYAWADGGCSGTADHYDIVVTALTTEFDQPGTIIEYRTGVTSPQSITFTQPSRVYLLSVMADGSYACWDYDEVDIAASFTPQIVRYQ